MVCYSCNRWGYHTAAECRRTKRYSKDLRPAATSPPSFQVAALNWEVEHLNEGIDGVEGHTHATACVEQPWETENC